LERDIERFGSYGSINKKEYLAPCDYHTLCFVSPEKRGANLGSGFSIIDEHVASGDTENVFLVGEYTKPLLADERVFGLNASGFVCINAANNKFKLTFKGLGTKTQIG
jgi:hypothetical protein